MRHLPLGLEESMRAATGETRKFTLWTERNRISFDQVNGFYNYYVCIDTGEVLQWVRTGPADWDWVECDPPPDIRARADKLVTAYLLLA